MHKITHTSPAVKRRLRVRARVRGTVERPRVTVHRSNRYIWVQVINDQAGLTVAAADDKKFVSGKKAGTKVERASQVGANIAQQLQKINITKVAFDRGSYRYHGRVKAVAEALRQSGIEV